MFTIGIILFILSVVVFIFMQLSVRVTKNELSELNNEIKGEESKITDTRSYATQARIERLNSKMKDLRDNLDLGQTVKRIALGVAGLAILLISLECIVVIKAGNIGVVDTFGNVNKTPLSQGLNFVNPASDVVRFSAKTQEIKEEMNVPSKEGLPIHLEISLLYRLNPSYAPVVYQTLGESYADVIITPNFRSVVRGVTADYEAKALYTSERELLTKKIEEHLRNILSSKGIVIESAPLRQVTLPEGLTASITEKLKAEQESQRMEFVLNKETKEAERKRIEAQGIKDFQKIVSEGISAQLLEWKGIEATEKLATSQNAKIIVIGSQKNGLPLVLGDGAK